MKFIILLMNILIIISCGPSKVRTIKSPCVSNQLLYPLDNRPDHSPCVKREIKDNDILLV